MEWLQSNPQREGRVWIEVKQHQLSLDNHLYDGYMGFIMVFFQMLACLKIPLIRNLKLKMSNTKNHNTFPPSFSIWSFSNAPASVDYTLFYKQRMSVKDLSEMGK